MRCSETITPSRETERYREKTGGDGAWTVSTRVDVGRVAVLAHMVFCMLDEVAP